MAAHRTALFQLKLETQISLRELEAEWQNILNELIRAEDDLRRTKIDPSAVKGMMDAFVQWGVHIRSSLGNVAKMREKFNREFDDASEEDTEMILRTAKALRVPLSNDKLEFKMKIDRFRSYVGHRS